MESGGQAAPGARTQAASARRDRLRTLRRRLAGLLAILLAVPVLGTLAVAALAVRLCVGPIEVGWLAHRLAPRVVAGEALGFDRVRLGWGEPERSGPGGPLTLTATGLALRQPDGVADLRAGRAVLALELAPLLSGTVSVRRVALDDASLLLRRAPDGAVFLAGAAPPAAHPGRGHAGAPRLDRLQQVAIVRSTVSLLDEASHRTLSAAIDDAALSPRDGLLVGRLRATLAVDGRPVAVEGDGVPDGDGLCWRLRVGALVPAAFAALLPSLAGIAVPVTPALVLRFGPHGGLPRSATLSLLLGGGTLAVGDGTLPLAGGTLSMAARPDGADGLLATVDGLTLALAAPPGREAAEAPTFSGRGTLRLDHLSGARRIRASLLVDSGRIGFDGLSRYWPQGVAAGARRWIAANLVDGVATGLHLESDLAGDAGWGSLREVRRAGGFDARDLVMWWLRPMPPLRGMRAHVSFQGTDALLVESPEATLPVEVVGAEARRLCPGATPAPIAVSDGSMRITGLDGRDQVGTIRVVLSGGLDGLMCELANPRLSLLSQHPVPFTAPSGRTRTAVTVRLPLDDAVAIGDVTVSARSDMRGAHLGDVAGGMALDDADMSVSADTDGLQLDGEGAVGPVDSRLHYAMDFRGGPPDQLVEQAEVRGTVGAAALSGLGLDAGDALGGDGALDVSYRARRDGQQRVALSLDMTPMAIALPVWSKAAGQPGHADAAILLDHGHLLSVGPIRIDGPALSIEGEVSTPDGGPRRLAVPRFRIGRTIGSGEVLFPRAGAGAGAGRPAAGGGGGVDPIRVTARGPALDLAAIIDSGSGGAQNLHTPLPGAARTAPARAVPAEKGPAAKGPAAKGPAWTADLRFGRVFVGRGTALGAVSAHLENDGRALVRAHVEAVAPTRIAVRLGTQDGNRLLDGSAEDTGALLRGLGVTDRIAGGRMQLSARLPPARAGGSAKAPIAGTVRIDRFELPDAPFAARLLRDLSIYGWLLAPDAPGLVVDRLVAPFSLSGEVLSLQDARAHAAALGVTMRGAVDLGRQRLDLHGTVVPAWALNQLPGRLPLVGRLLAPEKGGGVVAVTLAIRGPFAGPRVSVNALSALAPGFLRKLLFE